MNNPQIPYTIDQNHHAIAAICSHKHAQTWLTHNTNPAWTLNPTPLNPGIFCAHCVICAQLLMAQPTHCYQHHPDPCPALNVAALWFIPVAIQQAQHTGTITYPLPAAQLTTLLTFTEHLLTQTPDGVSPNDISELLTIITGP